jgi:flagellum-specific ATP synthase
VDGHIVLDRSLASRGHYPAIDVLSSLSRLMAQVAPQDHQKRAAEFRALLADYAGIEDLVNIGAYEKGASRRTDYALEMIDDLNSFLVQDVNTRAPMKETLEDMAKLLTVRKLGQ